MRNYLIIFTVLLTGLVSELYAQDCAGTAYGNSVGANGRFFLMTYDTQADRDAALANIDSITIDGTTYNVGPHPTGARTIRTTPARPAGTFPVSFTGTVTLNPSDEACFYTASLLPISLIYINAIREKSTILVKWATAVELNNQKFEIQTSIDGRNFETFSHLDGAGTTTEVQYYEVRHSDFSKGINYYRLKQIDYDGSFVYSPVVAVRVESSNIARLEKNILTTGQDVILLDADQGTFKIFNTAGIIMGSGSIQGQYQQLPTAGYTSGTYFVRTEAGNVLKFMVK